MPPFLLKLALLLTLVLTATSLAARVMGNTQPLNPALLGFTEGCEDKPQPCWYGIMPGVTTTEEGKQILDAVGYRVIPPQGNIPDNSLSYEGNSLPCSQAFVLSAIQVNPKSSNVSLINDLRFFRCQSVYLGDIVTAFGKPDEFYFWGWSFFHNQLHADMDFDYRARGNRCLSFMPKVEVSAISIEFVKGAFDRPIDTKYPWHGFLPFQQYVTKFGYEDCYALAKEP
jgi:hypothetical protein